MLLRGIVREVCGGRFVVHISDAALDVILTKAWTKSVSRTFCVCLHVHDPCCDIDAVRCIYINFFNRNKKTILSRNRGYWLVIVSFFC